MEVWETLEVTSKNSLVRRLILGTTIIVNDLLESFGIELSLIFHVNNEDTELFNACLMNMRFNLVTHDIQPYCLNPK